MALASGHIPTLRIKAEKKSARCIIFKNTAKIYLKETFKGIAYGSRGFEHFDKIWAPRRTFEL